MTNQRKVFLHTVVILAFSVTGFGKTPTLTGKIVAYDPLLHAAKVASFEANKEVVILEMPERKAKFVKVVFVSFGTTQIDKKYFDGTIPLVVHALRDRVCDEHSPPMVAELSMDQRSGTYLQTEAFKKTPPLKIKTLECYDAVEKK